MAVDRFYTGSRKGHVSGYNGITMSVSESSLDCLWKWHVSGYNGTGLSWMLPLAIYRKVSWMNESLTRVREIWGWWPRACEAYMKGRNRHRMDEVKMIEWGQMDLRFDLEVDEDERTAGMKSNFNNGDRLPTSSHYALLCNNDLTCCCQLWKILGSYQMHWIWKILEFTTNLKLRVCHVI